MVPSSETCGAKAQAPARRGLWRKALMSAPEQHSAMEFLPQSLQLAPYTATRPPPVNPLRRSLRTGLHELPRHPEKSYPAANAGGRVSCQNNRPATRHPPEWPDGAAETPSQPVPHLPHSRERRTPRHRVHAAQPHSPKPAWDANLRGIRWRQRRSSFSQISPEC